ncbi:CdaR family protein [Leptospira sp. GIMC2001]|uniref:CdaR family protein n=1 Tax=Leptospira sp. GIMC2001 TaxID=1513297 RepID=UPI002349CC67|nr:CdaR family protein [Leptospira sp. GIMC2001]WCL48741.1 CdaR family protein [Leptospira sp. GIMC2001]
MIQVRNLLPKLIEVFTKNWKVKLGSLLIASIFYVNLQNSKILIKTVNIPIEYPKLENGMYYSKNPEKSYPVRVEGLREVVNYYSQFMKAVVDPLDLKPGSNDVAIKRITGVPNGIKVTKLKSSIPIEIEGTATKQVILEATFEGDLPSNFEKVSFLVRPNRVNISGRQSDVEKLNKIVLPPISLQDQNESFVRKIRLPDLPKGTFIVGGVKEATVSVTITSLASKTGEQTITGIPVVCIDTNQYLEPELSEEQVSVKIFTRTPIKSSAIINGIQATVPCNNSYDLLRKKIIPSDQPVVTKIRVSRSRDLKNIEILQVIPDKVTVTYKVKNSSIQPSDDEEDNSNSDEVDPNDTPPPPPEGYKEEGKPN